MTEHIQSSMKTQYTISLRTIETVRIKPCYEFYRLEFSNEFRLFIGNITKANTNITNTEITNEFMRECLSIREAIIVMPLAGVIREYRFYQSLTQSRSIQKL